MVDAALTQPVRRDIDPPELRAAIASAFTDLAAAGDKGYDLAALRSLGLRFLDYDWESRYQSINQVGAERFYRELTAAEAFLTAALAAGERGGPSPLAGAPRPDAVLAEHARRRGPRSRQLRVPRTGSRARSPTMRPPAGRRRCGCGTRPSSAAPTAG